MVAKEDLNPYLKNLLSPIIKKIDKKLLLFFKIVKFIPLLGLFEINALMS